MSDRKVDHLSSLISDPSSKNSSLESLLQFAREVEVAIVCLAARLRNHLNHHGDRGEEATVQVIAERVHNLSIEFIAPFADGSAFRTPSASERADSAPDVASIASTAELPLVRVGQGTSRKDYYPEDFSAASAPLREASSVNIQHGLTEASENHGHFLSSAGMA